VKERTAGTLAMGRCFKEYLAGPYVYTCAHCKTHLALRESVLSKAFQGRNGRAYLFDKCVNYTLGPPEERMLMTGLHVVADVYCMECQTLIGWKYEEAYEESQRYKVGKVILEKAQILKGGDASSWADDE